jgi:hypothetical protein
MQREKPKRGNPMNHLEEATVQSEFSPSATWKIPDSSLERVLCAMEGRTLAFKVQGYLFSNHGVRASLKQRNGDVWALEYFPALDGLPLEQARAICEAFLVALRAVSRVTSNDF